MPARRTRVDVTCTICGKVFSAKPSVIKATGAKFCSHPCALKSRAVPLEERFRRYVGQPTETGCLLWTGPLSKRGRGIIGSGGREDFACLYAHRVAWEIANGPLPEGVYVCHSCDNPICVNVAHLFLGTQADNMADMVSKERQSRGEDHNHAKLTEEQVLLIRSRYATGEATQVELAAEYGIDKDHLSKIITRKYWRHLS